MPTDTLPSDLFTAAVAAGSAIIGGGLSGFFTLAALRRQHSHELSSLAEQRSHDAARAILGSLVALDHDLANWLGNPVLGDSARLGYNTFAETLATESVELRSREVRDRLAAHSTVSGTTLGVIFTNQRPLDGVGRQMVTAVRSHGLAMIRALEAHVRHEALPSYHGPDVTKVRSILDWAASAEAMPEPRT